MISEQLPLIFSSTPTYQLEQQLPPGLTASQVITFCLDLHNQKRVHPLIVEIREVAPLRTLEDGHTTTALHEVCLRLRLPCLSYFVRPPILES